MIMRNEDVKDLPLPMPVKQGDVGYDLYCSEEVVIPAKNMMPIDIPTGIRIKLPEGVWALIINRSSTPRKMGIEVVPGVIDNGYTGELFACCFNRTDEDIKVERGDRLAQFILMPAIVLPMEEVDELPATARGDTGFGSTGK